MLPMTAHSRFPVYMGQTACPGLETHHNHFVSHDKGVFDSKILAASTLFLRCAIQPAHSVDSSARAL